MKVGIVGSSGFLGLELLRLCAGHPEFDVVSAMAATQAGEMAGARYPSLRAAYPDLRFEPTSPAPLTGLDLVFVALPHGESQSLVPGLLGTVGVVVDLAADFRLTDPAAYSTWYGHEHSAPQLLGSFALGIPELYRGRIAGATAVAAAGCYPTAAGLALAPLLEAGLINRDGIVVDAASGVSGAGSGVTQANAFTTVDEDFRAYGVTTHRHTPEMEQILGASVLFTPHLAPMSRGILATCYARTAAPGVTAPQVNETLAAAYAHEPFIVVTDEPPSTKATVGSNCAHVSATLDDRTGWVIAMCALDNLMKGGSGQAVQCANLALGLPETTGLPVAGVYP
ncbi:MAG: N-acetyl-gamma-glutamyl-phosphate reductase [Acidimicrobiales bacterium]